MQAHTQRTSASSANSSDHVAYQMIARDAPLDPRELDALDDALEVTIVWGPTSVLHVAHLSPPRSFCIGESDDSEAPADFLIGEHTLGRRRLPLVCEQGGRVTIAVPEGAWGELIMPNAETIDFEELAAQGLLSPHFEDRAAYQFTLPRGAAAHVRYDAFTFIVRSVAAARRVAAVRPVEMSFSDSRWTVASFALHLFALMLFYFTPPSSAALSLDSLDSQSRLVQFVQETREQPIEPVPEWVDGQRERGEEGQMGNKDSPKTNNRYAVAGPKDNPRPRLPPKAQPAEVATQAGIIGVLQSAQVALNTVSSMYTAENAVGNDPMNAIGALLGANPGENFGFGGTGMRSTGRGGGGNGEGTVGVGITPGIGTAGYGKAVGVLRGDREARVPRIRPQTPDVFGSLSKEVIRRIVNRHLPEVRFCYEQRLNARPDLQGRVAVKFMIDRTGAVTTAAVAQSDLGDAIAENCISAAVKRMVFPQPEGGGLVGVTYPFVLMRAAD